MVNGWLNAEVSDDTPVTAGLSQVFTEFRAEYGMQSQTELALEHPCLPMLFVGSGPKLSR